MVDSSMAVPQSLQRGPTSVTSDLGLRPSSYDLSVSGNLSEALFERTLFPNKKHTPKMVEKGRNLLKIQTHIKDVHPQIPLTP